MTASRSALCLERAATLQVRSAATIMFFLIACLDAIRLIETIDRVRLPSTSTRPACENARTVIFEKNISLTGRRTIVVTSVLLGHAEMRR
jgi:hypothetical protein